MLTRLVSRLLLSSPQFDVCVALSVPGSVHTDPEPSQRLPWASKRGDTPVFVRTVADAALMACSPDYVLLRPVLLELKRRYPED